MSGFWNFDCQVNFTMSAIHELSGANNSVLISPAATFITLLMAFAGSNSNTLIEFFQFATCKHFGFHENIQHLVLQAGEFKKMQASGISQIYLKNGIVLNPIYAELLKKSRTDLFRVDFEKPETLALINNNVANETDHKLKQLIDNLDSNTTFLLTSAELFRSEWKVQFNAAKNGTFHVNDQTTKTIPMMQQTSKHFGYFENQHFRAVRIPFNALSQIQNKTCIMNINRTNGTRCYNDYQLPNPYTFLIFLPQKRFGLMEALTHLDGKVFLSVMGAHKTELDLTIPSFNLEYSVGLKDTLQKIGLKSGFDQEKADFSKMSDQHIYIKDFLQTSKIEINSESVEVEAATEEIGLPQKRSKRSIPKKIEVEEPFFYAIVLRGQNYIFQAGVFN